MISCWCCDRRRAAAGRRAAGTLALAERPRSDGEEVADVLDGALLRRLALLAAFDLADRSALAPVLEHVGDIDSGLVGECDDGVA
ncbi:MAG: hypothetical protein H0X17_12395 [Deltaproteobacteria bacterium]|nr:hypothetical protein [Deltaproteobacteria bacterium]